MSDSAKGPLSGYLFQFERALFHLSRLESKNNFIAVEKVDDVSIHKPDGTVIITEQAKHSISQSSTPYNTTSIQLWRTIEIWIKKLKNQELTSETKFICSSNKNIAENSILYILEKETDFSKIIDSITEIKKHQEKKLEKSKNGKSIQKVLEKINYTLNNQYFFKIICKKIQIDSKSTFKNSIYNNLNLNSKHKSSQEREIIYQDLYGWLIDTINYKWKDQENAVIYKKNLDTRLDIINSPSSIVQQIFRPLDTFQYLTSKKNYENYKEEIFIKQIKLIIRNKNSQEQTILKAIESFIAFEIEQKYTIEIGDITESDFKKYIKNCYDKWHKRFHSSFSEELEEYEEKEIRSISLEIYKYLTSEIKINFKNNISLSIENDYIQKGSFLKLSNVPKIGWHPEWEKHLLGQ